MFFLNHGPLHQPNLHLAERAHTLADGAAAVALGAKLLVEAAVHHEVQPPAVDQMEVFWNEMKRHGNTAAFMAAFGPTGLLGPEIERATRPDLAGTELAPIQTTIPE